KAKQPKRWPNKLYSILKGLKEDYQ
ncbi:hypothetical protein V3C99_015513, partial [Haemonchus contortus]